MEQKLQAVVFARLDDENIDVRKVRNAYPAKYRYIYIFFSQHYLILRKAAGRVVETCAIYKKQSSAGAAAVAAIFSDVLAALGQARRWGII